MRSTVLPLSCILGSMIVLGGCASLREGAMHKTPPALNGSAACFQYGDTKHFNEQRIKAFQQVVQNQISTVRSTYMTENNTVFLSQLEVLRRRTIYPFLQPDLNPAAVTKIIRREAGNLITVLETYAKDNPNTLKTAQYLNQNFLPNLESRDEWNCAQKTGTAEESTQKDLKIDSMPEDLNLAP